MSSSENETLPQEFHSLRIRELVRRTVSIFLQHSRVFLGIIAVPPLFVVTVGVFVLVVEAGGNEPPQPVDPIEQWRQLGWLVRLPFIVLFLASISSMYRSMAAIIIGTREFQRGRPIRIRDAYRRTFWKTTRVFWTLFAINLLAAQSVILLLPALVLQACYSLAIPIAVLERPGIAKAIRRAHSLAKGSIGTLSGVFILYLVCGLLAWSTASLIFAVPPGFTRLLAVAPFLMLWLLPTQLWMILLTLIYGELQSRVTSSP